jgi:hypothetical protein
VSDFHPGPAVKNVPLSIAPWKSQDIIAEFGRPEYAKPIAESDGAFARARQARARLSPLG